MLPSYLLLAEHPTLRKQWIINNKTESAGVRHEQDIGIPTLPQPSEVLRVD